MYMNKKNSKQKRAFIPQSIGETLRKVNRQFTSKNNRLEFIIHSKWPEICGKYFEEYTKPMDISRIANFENDLGETVYKNILNVSVAPAAAIELQHFKDKIIEKINSFFGYKAIFDLRIHQSYIPNLKGHREEMKFKKINQKDKELISHKVEDLTNSNLKNSLLNLGEKITIEDK